jgi:hypothetical protein
MPIRLTRIAWLPLACLLTGAVATPGSPGGALQLEELAGAGWNAQRLELDWNWNEGASLALRVTVAALDLERVGRFENLRLACPQASLVAGVASCRAATARFANASGAPVTARLAFSYDLVRDELALDLQQLDHCDGRLSGRVSVGSIGWSAKLTANHLAADCLAQAGWLPDPLPVEFTAGRIDGSAELTANDARLALVTELSVHDLAFGDQSGNVAGEELGAKLKGRWQRDSEGWQGEIDLQLERGVLFSDPVLVDAEIAPFTVTMKGRHAEGMLEVATLEVGQGDALRFSGRLDLAPDPWRVSAADVAFSSRELEGLYTTWLQPYLIGTALDDLEVSGTVAGRVNGVPGAWQIEVELEQIDLLDRQGRFALGGIAGDVAWGDADTRPSRLRWAGGQVLHLALGEAEASFTLRDGALVLLAPLRQPLVDGALAITTLEAAGIGSGAASMKLDGGLEPVSLEALGYAFDWPSMAGQIGGTVPALTYADGTLAVAGELRVDVFDGVIRIHDPHLQRPLGPVAALQADIEIEEIDLELLTRTFTIGRIEGRLGGRIDGLLLHDWRPVRFDAKVATPPGDDSRHRISQRAVNSITSVGGLGGVLSQSALRFFDEFGYSRLGFSCRLRGAVCELDGVEPAAGGYYLVKGGGLPRIDIIGHVRRVDWAELVDRLQRAMAAPAPVVQ